MRQLFFLFLLSGLLLTTACQSEKSDTANENRSRKEKTEAVDYEKLQDLLPNRLAGMKRVATEGERIGFLGIRYSQATAEYEYGDAWAEIVLLDGGGIARIVNELADDINADFDHEYENKEGYQKNIEIDGFPASEMYDYTDQEGELTIFVEDRFLVHIEAEDISERQFKRLGRAINVRKLARME